MARNEDDIEESISSALSVLMSIVIVYYLYKCFLR